MAAVVVYTAACVSWLLALRPVQGKFRQGSCGARPIVYVASILTAVSLVMVLSGPTLTGDLGSSVTGVNNGLDHGVTGNAAGGDASRAGSPMADKGGAVANGDAIPKGDALVVKDGTKGGGNGGVNKRTKETVLETSKSLLPIARDRVDTASKIRRAPKGTLCSRLVVISRPPKVGGSSLARKMHNVFGVRTLKKKPPCAPPGTAGGAVLVRMSFQHCTDPFRYWFQKNRDEYAWAQEILNCPKRPGFEVAARGSLDTCGTLIVDTHTLMRSIEHYRTVFRRPLDSPLDVVSMVRNPVDRCVSNFYYQRNRFRVDPMLTIDDALQDGWLAEPDKNGIPPFVHPRPKKKRKWRCSIPDKGSKYRTNDEAFRINARAACNNYMVYHFCGQHHSDCVSRGPKEAFKSSLSMLQHPHVHVGVLERSKETMLYFDLALGEAMVDRTTLHKPLAVSNKGSYPPVSQQTREALQAMNEFDFALYDAVNAELDARLSEYK